MNYCLATVKQNADDADDTDKRGFLFDEDIIIICENPHYPRHPCSFGAAPAFAFAIFTTAPKQGRSTDLA